MKRNISETMGEHFSMDLLNAIRELTLGPNFFRGALKEKRQIPRIVCNIKAHTRIKGRKQLLKITDVGIRGIKIETHVKLPKDLTFRITVDTDTGALQYGGFTRDTLLVKVAWCRRQRFQEVHSAGLLFIDNETNLKNSWVYHMFNEMGVDQNTLFKKRESYRVHIELPVSCSLASGFRLSGLIQNIGLGGVLIKCHDEIPMGETVNMGIGPYGRFKVINVQGKVVRSSYIDVSYQYFMGIEFLDMRAKEYRTIGNLIVTILRDRKEKTSY